MNQAMLLKLKKMQKEMQDAQQRIQETIFEGTAAGIVSIKIKGNYEVVSVDIDKSQIDDIDDLDMINDSIKAAFNDAINKINKETEKVLGPYGQGLGGLF